MGDMYIMKCNGWLVMIASMKRNEVNQILIERLQHKLIDVRSE